jgi:outer membrane protein TolC
MIAVNKITCLAMTIVGFCAAVAAGSDTASGRLLATQEAALEGSEDLRARLSELRAEEAAARALGAPGTPYLEFQTEGLSSSFDRSPNAQDTVRVGAPFNMPGVTSSVRRHAEATTSWATARRTAEELMTLGEVSRHWLQLASSTESSAVLRRKVDRLEEALALQEAKHQLGEVAGTDVRQVDLEHVREGSRLAALQAELQAFRQRLWAMCKDRCQPSVEGDLAALVHLTRTPGVEEIEIASVEAGPFYLEALHIAEARRARADVDASTAWGRPAVVAEWERFPSLEGLDGYDAWGLSLFVPLPLGREGRQRKAAAGAEAAAADARVAAAGIELESRLRTARTTAVEAEARLRVLEPVVEGLGETEHSLREQFRLGSISYLVFIDGLSRLDDVRVECIEARTQLLLARLECAVLLGDDQYFPLTVLSEEEVPQ